MTVNVAIHLGIFSVLNETSKPVIGRADYCQAGGSVVGWLVVLNKALFWESLTDGKCRVHHATSDSQWLR